tara:strand:- start:307 stop:624 length:318 start_codon:yes stop_codon:yes gene_type:complete
MTFNKKEYYKQWAIDNAIKKNEATKRWRKNNPEKYRKSNTISNWKLSGIIDEDLSTVYDYFITQTHCWICDVEYCEKNKRSLDHYHPTGEIRYICCNPCNMHVVR